jgi:transposase
MNKTKNVSQEEEPYLVLEKVCGLDVHKKSCTAAIVDQGKVPLVLDDIENSGPGIHRLYQRLVEEGCSTVVMESTGPYWIGLYDYLDLRGVNTVIVSPQSLKAFGGKKTDRHDAVWLAHLYRIDLLKPGYVPPRHIRELRSLTRRLEKIVHMMTSMKLSIQSQIDAFSTGITTTYTDPFGLGGTRIMKALGKTIKQGQKIDVDRVIDQLRQEGLPPKRLDSVEKMLRISFDPTSNGWLIEQGLDTLQALKEQRDQILDRVAKHIQQHQDLSRSVRILLSICGIDMVSAAVIVAEMGDPHRFEDGKAVSSYFGLVPSVDQSGPITVLGRITKKGSPHMRRILCQIAQVVATKGAPHLQRWYAQVKARRGGQKAIVALARRILVIVWAMLRDQTQFQDPDNPDTDKDQHAARLHRNKLRAMDKRAQRSAKTISMWRALHLLATDQKLRSELGLARIARKPSTHRKSPN